MASLRARANHAIRALRVLIQRARRRLYFGIHHDAVMGHLSREGRISVRYGILTVLSCGIAILGLLQSSPAVVIGAMLISPLMGPILLSGFSLATLDHRLALKGLKATAFGSLLAILQAATIVWLSPLTSVTAEILARTRPNFFDLVVAIFSGVAGAYAVAHRKGETIVGVAIATALMPPLAVIGYGLAVGNWAIFSGASGLYMTNLLAIGLTASLVARVFGFGAAHPKRHRTLHTAAIIAAFTLLSIPLGFSLRQIAHEAVLSAKAKTTLNAYFSPRGDHLYSMEIRFPDDRPVEIDALVFTEETRVGIESRMRDRLQEALGLPVSLSLSQVPVRSRESLDRQAVAAMIDRTAAAMHRRLRPPPDIALETAAASRVPRLAISTDPQDRRALIRAEASDPARLAALRAAQSDLTHRFAPWQFTFHIPIASLPSIAFAEGTATLDARATALIGDIAWALRENGVATLRVIGFSDRAGPLHANRRMAKLRADAVAAVLRAQGFSVDAEARYPAHNQVRLEREGGRARFRRAEIAASPH